MSGVLRSLPLRAPTEVRTMIGTPRIVLASRPSDCSYCSACVRACSDVLGAYSPVRGMPRATVPTARGFPVAGSEVEEVPEVLVDVGKGRVVHDADDGRQPLPRHGAR